MSQGSVDDLFAHKGANLFLYLNNPTDPGAAPQFGSTADINPITKPSCAATASNAGNCAGYDGTDWSDTTQILAPGDVYGTGLPDLLTVRTASSGCTRASTATTSTRRCCLAAAAEPRTGAG